MKTSTFPHVIFSFTVNPHPDCPSSGVDPYFSRSFRVFQFNFFIHLKISTDSRYGPLLFSPLQSSRVCLYAKHFFPSSNMKMKMSDRIAIMKLRQCWRLRHTELQKRTTNGRTERQKCPKKHDFNNKINSSIEWIFFPNAIVVLPEVSSFLFLGFGVFPC